MTPGMLVSFSPHWAAEMNIRDHRLYMIVSYDSKNKQCHAITSSTGEIKRFWAVDLIEC